MTFVQVFPDSLVNSSWVEEPAPLFLPPAAFSRMDLPQDYQYRREAAGEKTSMLTHYNVIGRTRQRRSHHAIFVTFDVDKVPDRPRDIAVSQLKVKFIAKRFYTTYRTTLRFRFLIQYFSIVTWKK